MRPAHSEATRYLCVGAELDDVFARQVISELIAEQHRAVAPSYGIDVVPVLKHCLKGERRRTFRDLALMLVVLAEVLLAPIPAAAAIVGATWTRRTYRERRGLGQVVGLILAGLYGLGIWAWFQYRSQLPVVLSYPGGMVRVVPFLLILPAAVVVAALICYAEWYIGRKLVARHLRQDTFDPDTVHVRLSARTSRRLEVIAAQQYSPLTVYHAAADFPFIGAGRVQTESMWSFALDLQRPAEAFKTNARKIEPFTPTDLYGFVEEQLRVLADPSLGLAYWLPELQVLDQEYISGLTMWDGMPAHVRLARTPATPKEMARIANMPVGLIRHFKCVRIESWGGDLVSSVFLHFATQGRTLYVEFTPCFLPPILSAYHIVDGSPATTPYERLQAARGALRTAVSSMLDAPGNLLRTRRLSSEHTRRESEVQQSISRGYAVDYGARIGVRQLGAMAEPEHYFQQLDARKYLRVIEVQVLSAITEFLDKRGIDTSDLRARQTQILNHGVFMPGATIQGQGIAIGKEAKASVRSGEASGAGSRGATSSS